MILAHLDHTSEHLDTDVGSNPMSMAFPAYVEFLRRANHPVSDIVQDTRVPNNKVVSVDGEDIDVEHFLVSLHYRLSRLLFVPELLGLVYHV